MDREKMITRLLYLLSTIQVSPLFAADAVAEFRDGLVADGLDSEAAYAAVRRLDKAVNILRVAGEVLADEHIAKIVLGQLIITAEGHMASTAVRGAFTAEEAEEAN